VRHNAGAWPVPDALVKSCAGLRKNEGVMVLGIGLSTYTIIHVIISLIGIVTGFVVIFGMTGNHRLNGWTFWFLLFTVLTSLTGFGFPFDHLLPSHIVGIISLVVLLIAIVARYSFGLDGPWRWIFIVTAVVAQWFNLFVLVVQSFQKIDFLRVMAPTQSEPPFQIAQGAVLIVMIVLAAAALRKFHPQTA
jgi:hypothetical protein